MLKELFKNYFAAIGLADGQIASLFNEDGTELKPEASAILTQHDATRIQKIRTDVKTEGFNEGHQKGTKDGFEKLEKELKEEYGIDSVKKGKELIAEIVSTKSNQKPPELEVDKVKLHPAFVEMENTLKKQIKEKETEWQTKYENRDKEIAQQDMFSKVVSKAKVILSGLKPILPKDEKKATKQMELLIQDLKGFDFTLNQDGSDFIISKDGKPYQDPHGNRIDFENLIKGNASSIWDFEEGDTRSAAGNNNNANTNTTGGQKIVTPKTEQEYIQAITNEQDSEKRMAIDDAWTKSQNETKV